MSSADLTFDITARDNASAAVGKVAAALNRMDRSAATADKTHRSLGTTTGRVASDMKKAWGVLGGIATAAAVVKIAQFGKDSIRAASDLQEATSAAGVMFGKQKQAIVEWADTAATAFGQSRTRALQSATGFAGIAEQADLTGKKMVTFSTSLTELATDLASFHNTSLEESLTALGAGLRGESEPLRRFNVDVSDATLRQRAMKMGIYDGTGALTQQQKVLAAYAQVMADTRKEQGDFQRTQGGWANQTRMFSEQLENLKSTAGKALLPIATDYIQRINRAMPELEKSIGRYAPDVGKALIGISDAVADNWPEIKDAFMSVADAGQRVGGVLKAVFSGFRSLPPGIQDAALQLGAIAAAMKLISKTGIGSALTGGVKLGRSVLGGGGVSSVRTMVVNAGVVNVNGKGVGGGPGGVVPKGGGVPPAAGAFGNTAAAAVIASAIKTAVVASVSTAIGAAIPALVASIGNSLQRNFPGLSDTPTGRDPGTGGRADGPGGVEDTPVPGRFGRLTPDLNAATAAAKRNAEALKAVGAAATTGTARTRFLAAAVGNYRTAATNATRAAKNSEAGIKGNTQAAARNRTALQGQAIAARGVLSNMQKMGASTRSVTSTQNKLGQAFVRTAKDMGVPQREARQLARSFGLIPKRKDTNVRAPGAKDARRDVDNHTRSANKVPGRKDTKVGAPGAKDAKRDIDNANKAANSLKPSANVNVAAPGATEADAQITSAHEAARAADGAISTITTVLETIKRTVTEQAQGGYIRGPGTTTSDSIPAMLSDREYVIRAASVDRIGVARLDHINATGTLPTFKNGGQVRAAATIGNRTVGPDAADGWTPAEMAAINAAIDQAVAASRADTKSRRRRKGESEKDYARRIRRMDSREELVSIARSAKQAAESKIRNQRAKERQANADAKAKSDAQREAYFAALEEQKRAQEERDAAAAQYRSDAASAYGSFIDEARGGIGQGLGAAKGFASASGFDLNAAAQAQEELRLAQSAVNTANTPAERQQALAAVQQAQAKAAASAVTPANVVKNFRDKIAKVREFKDALTSLRDRGLNPTTLSEIAQMDPESGLTLAKAIQGSNLAEINGLQSELLAVGAQYGALAHNANLGADAEATAVMDSVISRGGIATTVNLTSQLVLDGRVVYESLKAIERQQGGPLWRN